MKLFKKSETLNDRIKKLRKEKGLTQLELAEQLNITDKAVSKWESGDGNPDISLLPKLAEIFSVTTDYLLTGKEIEEKLVPISKLELCAKKDDIKLIDGLQDLSIKDENGKTLFDYIVMYESTKVFAEIIDKGRANGLFTSTRSGSCTPEHVTEIIFLCLISNKIDKLSAFGFNSFESVTKDELSNKTIKAIIDDKRISKETRSLIFSMHTRKPTDSKGENLSTYEPGYGYYATLSNWQEIYPLILDESVNLKNKEMTTFLLDLIDSINEPCVKSAEKGTKRSEQIVLSRNNKPYLNYYSKTTYLYVAEVKKSTLDKLLEQKEYIILEKANSINNRIQGTTITEREIKIAKMEDNKEISPNEIALEKCVHHGLLYIDEVLSLSDFDLKVKAIKTKPIHFYELLNDYITKEDYKSLFKFGAEYGHQTLADLAMNKDREGCLNYIKNLFAGRQMPDLKLDELQNINFKWLNKKKGAYYINQYHPGTVNEIITDIAVAREEIIRTITFEKEKEKCAGDLTKEYFDDLFKNSNYEMIIIKLCVKLESILKYDRRYEGTFEEMLNSYCETFNTRDDEANDYDPETPKLLQKLRKARNGIVHSDPSDSDMTERELKDCLSHIFSLERGN